jgi:hypothetical protein
MTLTTDLAPGLLAGAFHLAVVKRARICVLLQPVYEFSPGQKRKLAGAFCMLANGHQKEPQARRGPLTLGA